MTIIRDLNALPDALLHGAVTIGNFDGVHRGHAKIVERLRVMAEAVSGPAIVFTFDPHPVSLLRPDAVPPSLSWLERKAKLLSQLGVDAVIAYPTDLDLLELGPQEFFQKTLIECLSARGIVEGPNFFFGKDRQGNVDTLRSLCDERGLALEIVEPVPLPDGRMASSSQIRRWIAEGEIAQANEMLTAPYRVQGRVAHGASRGAGIGFPTANLVQVSTLMPRPGVYSGRTEVDGQSYLVAINVGSRPTFHDETPALEVHLLDFDGNLYGRMLEVDFTNRLRDIQAFADVSALQAQLRRDVQQVRETGGG